MESGRKGRRTRTHPHGTASEPGFVGRMFLCPVHPSWHSRMGSSARHEQILLISAQKTPILQGPSSPGCLSSDEFVPTEQDTRTEERDTAGGPSNPIPASPSTVQVLFSPQTAHVTTRFPALALTTSTSRATAALSPAPTAASKPVFPVGRAERQTGPCCCSPKVGGEKGTPGNVGFSLASVR